MILVLLAISVGFNLVQNTAGIAFAVPMDQHPLFGVLNSSATLVGGPATGLSGGADCGGVFHRSGKRGHHHHVHRYFQVSL